MMRFQFFHHQLAAHKERGALVQFRWLYLQYPYMAIGGFSAGHFEYETKGIRT